MAGTNTEKPTGKTEQKKQAIKVPKQNKGNKKAITKAPVQKREEIIEENKIETKVEENKTEIESKGEKSEVETKTQTQPNYFD